MRHLQYSRLAAFILLTGCATSAKFESKMNGFVGRPEGDVVMTYGPPMSSYELADGAKIISYTRGGTVVVPGIPTTRPIRTDTTGTMTLNQGIYQSTANYNAHSTTYAQETGPSVPVALSCTVNFKIQQGTIIGWASTGNHCVAD